MKIKIVFQQLNKYMYLKIKILFNTSNTISSYKTGGWVWETWWHYCPIGSRIQSDSIVAVACPSIPNNEAVHAQPLIEHWLTHRSSTDNFFDQPTYGHDYVSFTF